MRARSFLEEQDRKFDEERRSLGVSDDLAALEGVGGAMLVIFGNNGIKTLDDLGDLASDELLEMLGEKGPTVEEANAIIMAARAHWFDDEEPAEAVSEEAGENSEIAEAQDEAQNEEVPGS